MGPREWLDLNLDLARADHTALDRQRQAVDACLAEPREGDDVDALITRAGAVADAIAAWNARAAAREQARARLAGGPTAPPRPTADAPEGRAEEPPAGRQIITVEGAARAVATAPGLRGYTGGRVHVHVAGSTVDQRALFSSDLYPSNPARLPGILQSTPDAPTTILDLIDRQAMTTQVIEYVQETAIPTGAAEVAEGAVKPESTLGFTLKDARAATIAHWVNITRQTLEDEAQIEGYIRGRMTYGLRRRLNTQILSGNGTAPNLRGITTTSGIGSYVAPANEDPIVSIRKARTVAELSEFPPDGVVLNPVDWERIELSQTTTGEFRVVASVAAGAAARLWGLAVVVTPNIVGSTGAVGGGGRFLLGGFREGATLWERTGIDFYVTDSHASNFTSNILTMLCEMRAALAVWRPAAFVYGTLDDGV